MNIEELLEINKTEKRIKIDTSVHDPIVYFGGKKIAFYIRGKTEFKYTIGLLFDLEGYEPIEVFTLQCAFFEIKKILKSIGVEILPLFYFIPFICL
jgi:hypothetical protein